MTKYCSGCKTHKILEEFQKLSAAPDGLNSRCKACLNRYRREGGWNTVAKRKQPKYDAETQLKYLATVKGRAQMLYYAAATRAKKKDRDFSIDIDWVREKMKPMLCEVTGLPLSLEKSGTRNGQFAPSLDRKDNSLGYTKDNTMIVCFMYNRAKADGKHEDVMTMARALVNKEGV